MMMASGPAKASASRGISLRSATWEGVSHTRAAETDTIKRATAAARDTAIFLVLLKCVILFSFSDSRARWRSRFAVRS